MSFNTSKFSVMVTTESKKKARALFVYGHPELFEKTYGFEHYNIPRQVGTVSIVHFTYNPTKGSRRFVRAITIGKLTADKKLYEDPTLMVEIENFFKNKGGAVLHPNVFSAKAAENFQSFSDVNLTEANDELKNKVPMDKRNPLHTAGEKVAKFGERRLMKDYVEYDGFFTVESVISLFDAMAAKAKACGAANVLAVGPSGSGKTSFPKLFAAKQGMDFIKVDTALIADPEEFLGKRGAKDGTTYFEKSELAQKVEAGNVVVLFDEFNRAQPWILNGLYGWLDDTRETGGIKVGDNVIFVASMNLGARFTGTFVMDAAMSNRFNATVKFNYPRRTQEEKILKTRIPSLEEDDVQKVVEVVKALRTFEKEVDCGLDVSVRTSLRMAELLAYSPEMAWTHIVSFTIASFITDDEIEKELWDKVNPLIGVSPS